MSDRQRQLRQIGPSGEEEVAKSARYELMLDGRFFGLPAAT
jgi:hypothetical protein